MECSTDKAKISLHPVIFHHFQAAQMQDISKTR